MKSFGRKTKRWTARTVGVLLTVGLAPSLSVGAAGAAPAPVGQGFTVTTGDLAFILKQIKISERHAATATPADPCGTLVGSGPDQ
ncbi:MAG: hypothetical protein QOF92_1062, partial [Pseudonocardiales bacterium]|nr:hypothetical protein [Pseudonocardiales bacterium]